MKRTAVYCRVSTEDQEKEGTSLITQQEAASVYCQERGYEIAYKFSEAFSGLTLERPKLTELRELVRSQQIDVVVVYCLDRISRDPTHGVILFQELEKNGVSIEAVTEDIDNTELGKLISYIRGFASKLEAEKIKERTMRGKKAKAKEGRLSTGGVSPFGYLMVEGEGRRKIVEEEADIIRWIFNKLAYDRYTLYGVADELNKAGIPGPRGGKWSEHTVWRIVNNEAYCGKQYVFRYRTVEPKNPKKSPAGKRTTHVLRDKSEWIEVPDVTPAIVTPEVYQLAQEQLEANRRRSPRIKKHDYLFSGGRLRCGICGHSMVGSAKKKKNGDLRLYRCVCNTKPNYYQPCKQRSIAAHRIEPQIWEEIMQLLKNPERVMQELEKEKSTRKPVNLEADRVMIQKAIDDSHEEEVAYLRQYGKGIISEEQLHKEALRVQAYRREQEEKLEKLVKQLEEYEQAVYNYEQFTEALKMIGSRLDNADYETKQLVLEALNIQVILQPDQVAVLTGIIPPRERIIAQSHNRALWNDLGRRDAAGRGQADQPGA